MINLLMFDLDGTLFDTAPGIANAFNRLVIKRGGQPVPTETVIKYIGTGLRDFLRHLEADLALRMGDPDELEVEFHREYRRTYLEDSKLYSGVVDFLRQWPRDIAVVSNKDQAYVRELVAQSELSLFKWSSLIGGNTFHVKKPHPLPLQEAMRAAGANPRQSLIIGDGLPDVLGAKAAGVKCVAISFGYTPLADLIQNGAEHAIDSYQELPKLIENLSSN